MRIEILLKNLHLSLNQNHPGHLKINIGDYLHIISSEQQSIDGFYYFMQKNIIQMNSTLPNYITFDFFCKNSLKAHISLFLSQAIQKTSVMLNTVHSHNKCQYNLNYQIKIIQHCKNDHKNIPFKLKKRKSTIAEDICTISQKGDIKVLQLGKITYSFAKRLDPLVSIVKKLKTILTWKKPQITITLGIILSLIVLFPKLSIIAISFCLIFGKSYLIDQFEKYLLKQQMTTRLLPPQQNLNFLKELMEFYYNIFQNVFEFFSQHDRTNIITIVQIVTKCGVIMFILSLLLSIQILIIVAIWLILIANSSTGYRAKKYFWPKIITMNNKVDDVLQNVSKNSVVRVLNASRYQSTLLFKQFYIYQYQRWWLGKQWVPSHYSNQQRKIVLQAKKDPPLGWIWLGPWQIQKNQNTDLQGFQYTNDFLLHVYSPSKSLKTIRRRKWVRISKKVIDMQLPKLNKNQQSHTSNNSSNFQRPSSNSINFNNVVKSKSS